LLLALSSTFKNQLHRFEKFLHAANRSNPPLSVLLQQMYAGVSMSELN
jgi:mRNA degradation ribonuclease J1/J2